MNALSAPIRIAMWSGPRNISTAMLRSWGSRDDTFVSDEPLYAHYLATTGIDHPGADEVVAAGETDWRRVVRTLSGPVPGGRAIWYQKHMAHHLLPGMDRAWTVDGFRNVLLLRDPAAMLASLARVLPDPTLGQTGLPQQLELFRLWRDRLGAPPPVLLSSDVLRDPRAMLEALCARLDVPFLETMLRWEPGPRDTDGVWAKHWYANVERSTGFGPPRETGAGPPERLAPVLARCREIFDELVEHRIRVA